MTTGRKYVIDPTHYHQTGYDDKHRFIGYWNQINAIMTLNMQPILEIGVGNSFVSNYLKQKQIDITTVDIDERLMPDVVGSILSLPFADRTFRVAVCYEVLEHLPYSEFPKGLREIHRVTEEYAILSLPDATQAYRIEFWIPGLGAFSGLLKLPWVSHRHVIDPDHQWEIGLHDYPLKRIMTDIKKAGFELVRTYRIFEHPYHRFFKLIKVNTK